MNIRKMIAFVVMLPTWPLAVIAAAVDDEASVTDIMSGFKEMLKRIYEK